MFVASYIQSGGIFCLFVAGIFCALTLHIHGFVPPCGALMRPLPLWCRTTGKAEQPTQRAMEMGLFEVKKTAINKPDGSVLVSCTTKVTGKGQVYFVNKFLDEAA